MTVDELVEELLLQDKDLEVVVAYNYGDYWHTTVTPDILSIDETFIEYSDYHRMNKLVEDPEPDTDNVKKVIVLFTIRK